MNALLVRMGDGLLSLWSKSPARIVAFTIAALDLAVAFGLNISTDQQSKIVAFVGALIVLLGGEIVRANVTSPNTIAHSNVPIDLPPAQDAALEVAMTARSMTATSPAFKVSSTHPAGKP